MDDICASKAVIWQDTILEGEILDSTCIGVNSHQLSHLINNKLNFRNFFKQHNLEQVRPRSWVFSVNNVQDAIHEILASSEGVDKLILKLVDGVEGKGIIPLKRDEFVQRMLQIFVEPFDDSLFDIGDPIPIEGWMRHRDSHYLIEEYIASKPIRSSFDNQLYDATLRIALMTLANKGKVAIVPICSYWKLPGKPITSEWNINSVISDVHQINPSEVVSPKDFQHAFKTIAQVLPTILVS